MEIKMILTNGFDPDPRVYKEAGVLMECGYKVEILCWDRDNRYYDKPTEDYNGIKIKRFFPKSEYGSGYNQIYSYWQFIKQIKLYLYKQNYDVIHTHDIDGAFAGLFVKKSAKLIWDMHEFYDGFNYGFLKGNLFEMIARQCFKKTDGIIYVSSSQKERYKNKKKQHTQDIIVMNAPEESMFKEFKRNTSKNLRISFIGSLREYNTLKKIMDIGEKYNNITINLNGAGVAYRDLKKLETRYKNTNITGGFNYSQIKSLYENTDVIYAVYNSELVNVKYAFPVKGLEAIATETPIITNKNTSFGDFVENFDIGFTVDESSGFELDELIGSLLADIDLLNVKKANISKIKDKFKWSEQSNKLINLYQNL